MQVGEISGTLAQFVTAVMKIEQSRLATVLRLNPEQFHETFHAQAGTPESPGLPQADLEVIRLTVALASGQGVPVSLKDIGDALDAAASAGAVASRLRQDWADATISIRTYLDQAGAMPRPPDRSSAPTRPDDSTPGNAGKPDRPVSAGAEALSVSSDSASEDPAVADGIVSDAVRNDARAESGPEPTGESAAGPTKTGPATPLDRVGQGDRITREEVLWVVVEGLRASARTGAAADVETAAVDADRARQFDAWRHAPPFFAMVERLFLNAMVDLIATLSSMRTHIVQPALTKVIAAGSPASSSMIDRY